MHTYIFYTSESVGGTISENCFLICIYCILCIVVFRFPNTVFLVIMNVNTYHHLIEGFAMCGTMKYECMHMGVQTHSPIHFVQYLYDKFFGLSVAECK